MASMLALQIIFAPGASSATGKVTVWLEENDLSTCFADVLTSANKNSGLRFDMTAKPQLTEAMRTALASGGAPDVIFTPGPAFTSEFAKAGLLEPLDSYAKSLVGISQSHLGTWLLVKLTVSCTALVQSKRLCCSGTTKLS